MSYVKGIKLYLSENVPPSYDNLISFAIDGLKVESTLTDFPVRLYLSPSGSGNIDWSPVFTELGSNNKKISIQDSNSNEHYVEISSWVPSASKAIIDFKVPVISAGIDQEFTFYYDSLVPDNTTYVSETGDTGAQNVWDDNYLGVYHLVSDPSSTLINSKGLTDYNGTPINFTSNDLVDDDLVIKSWNFPSFAAAHNVGVGDLVAANMTVESTFKVAPTDTYVMSLLSKDYTGNNIRCYQFRVNSGTIDFIGFSSNNPFTDSIGSGLNDNNWHYAAGKGDGSNIYAIADTTVGSGTACGDIDQDVDPGHPAFIGRMETGSASYFTGNISEARFSNIARSNEWLKTTNYTLKDELIISIAEETTNVSPSVELLTLTLTQPSVNVEIPISFSTNFSEYTLSTQPSGWTERYGNASSAWNVVEEVDSIYGGTVLQKTRSFDDRVVLTIDELDGLDNAEVLLLSRINSTGTAIDAAGGICARAGGSENVENGYFTYINSQDDSLVLVKYVGASTNNLYTALNGSLLSWNAADWMWTRLQLNGSSLKVKWWLYGTDEPVAWSSEVTDAIYSNGWWGVFDYDGVDSQWDYLKIESDSNNWPIAIPSIDVVDVSPSVELQSLSLAQYGSTVDAEVNVSKAVNLLSKTLAQYGSTVDAEINVSKAVNLLSKTLAQYGSTVDAEINIDVLLNLLSKTLAQYGSTVDAEVNVSKAVNLLSKTLAQYGSTVYLISNPTINLNILQQQILINELTVDIINRLLFPITGGLDKKDGTSFKKGLDRVYNPNTVTGGLTKSYNINSIIKGIEIVKR